MAADNQYAATYHIPVKAGTFFKPVFMVADTAKVVINETAAKALGFAAPENAIGQNIMIPGVNIPFTICGVTADFHFGSMRGLIQPMVFYNVNYTTFYRFFSIRIRPGNMQNDLQALRKKWAELMPGAPFEYSFVDDALKKVYQNEIQLKQASYIATALAIVIVLLGVLGLISLSIQKRTKEIGIRKVLGSSVAGIISLFMKEFLGVVLIAGLIACPVAYLIMHNWLNDYAYKIVINLNPFMMAIGMLTLVTAVLIALQTIKAALDSPVKSLRSE
jgi:ABC-type antimicrobial peptide transport system permease subunit